ncbi:DUF5340 domain-containing protein [Leptolyngbya sp. AN03gr2]|uniref:DUF5340 domain-containing protein n=1 Tax=unclassified Leptolyngbya TaxID=2650499 RepID=UPI003D320302
MEPIPLPSHIHYELLLQLLERQTMFAVDAKHRDQVQQLIIALRKALSQQKRLEGELERLNISIEYRWSLNSAEMPTEAVTLPPEPKH